MSNYSIQIQVLPTLSLLFLYLVYLNYNPVARLNVCSQPHIAGNHDAPLTFNYNLKYASQFSHLHPTNFLTFRVQSKRLNAFMLKSKSVPKLNPLYEPSCPMSSRTQILSMSYLWMPKPKSHRYSFAFCFVI